MASPRSDVNGHTPPKITIPENVSEFYVNALFGTTGVDFMMLFGSMTLPTTIVLNAQFLEQIFSAPEFSRPVKLPITISMNKPATASEWMEHNKSKLAKYTGKYVAITHSGIVAKADSLNDVYSKAKQRGFMNPLVVKIPKVLSRHKIVSVKLA